MVDQIDNPPAEDMRNRLMQSALKLFIERGYAATSVREIVAAAGGTKPVLYYYFKNKEGLYLEIMDGIGRAFDLRISELSIASGSVRERLIHFFLGLFDGAHENLGVVRLAYAIYFGPPQGAPFIDFNRFFDQTLAQVGRLIEEGMACGEIRECNPHALAWALVGSHQTIMEEQLCRPLPRVDGAGLKEIINLILDGVTPLPGDRDNARCRG